MNPDEFAPALDTVRQIVAEYKEEINRLQAKCDALQEGIDAIRYHGTDAPAAANYPEEEWWRKVAYDCMALAYRANEAAEKAANTGDEKCDDATT